MQVGLHHVYKSFGQQRRVVKAFRAEEPQAEVVRGFGEGDVDVVENFYVVGEEADRLQDDGGMARGSEVGKGIFDSGANPGASGNALALEGEEPGFEAGEFAGG